MNILEMLFGMLGGAKAKIDPAAKALTELIEAGGEARPELKPQADRLLEELRGAVDPAKLADVILALPKEGMDIVMLKLDPRDHPSDLA